jgi:hypothetical protein
VRRGYHPMEHQIVLFCSSQCILQHTYHLGWQSDSTLKRGTQTSPQDLTISSDLSNTRHTTLAHTCVDISNKTSPNSQGMARCHIARQLVCLSRQLSSCGMARCWHLSPIFLRGLPICTELPKKHRNLNNGG